MDRLDLTFSTEKDAFSLRVRAIIIDEGKLLMVKHPTGYYFPIGGRVQLHESSFDAVLREVKEETGIGMEIDRIGYLHENFFWDDKRSIRHHEVAVYYYMKPVRDLKSRELRSSEGDELCWLPLNELSDKRLYPTFFKTRLQQPSPHLEHIFTWED